MKKMSLYGKTAIISGISSGIGKQIARILILKYDCKIIGIARNEQKIADFKESLGQKSQNLIDYFLFDVSVEQKWKELAEYIERKDIDINILINCAGMLPKFTKFENYSLEDAQKVVDVNFMSAVYSAKYFLSILKKNIDSSLVNISSSSALASFGGISLYSATKSALLSFSLSLADEYSKQINVCCICPGFTDTEVFRGQNANQKELDFTRKLCTPCDKMSKKIIKAIKKRKKLAVLGYDAKLMNFFGKIMPVTTGKIISKILKKSKFEMFKEI